ncbi:MAG: ATP-binding protein, partial [Verrucomicrobiae bacterium]
SRRCAKSGCRAAGAALSDIFKISNGRIFLEAVSCVHGARRQPLGILILRSDVTGQLIALLDLWPAPIHTNETLLVMRDGSDVVFLNRRAAEPGRVSYVREPLTKTHLPAVQAVLGKTGNYRGKDYRGSDVISDLRPVPGTPWFMVTKIDAGELLVDAREEALVVGIFVAFLILLTAAGLAAGYGRLRTHHTRELYEAQRLKLEMQENYRQLFESMLDGFALHDILCDDAGHPVDYRFLSVNPAFERMTGLRAADVIGRTALEIMPETEPRWIERYGRVALTGEGEQFTEYSRVLKRHFEIAAFRPQPGQFATVFMDVTERKAAEARLQSTLADLEHSNKELEQFAYIASHDLQEPLRMVSSYTQLLAQRYESQLDDKARKYIHYAVDGAIRMQSLINDLLAYSRVGTRGQKPEPADAHAILGEAIRNLSSAIEENRAIITSEDLPTVRADAPHLLLVFQNLLANAIKFRGKDLPCIHVSAQERPDDWVFSVKDNGIGIEPQHAGRVFVIFQRLHTREEYPGTGIGLSICQRIIERHGGKIWFESEPGIGTTFFFTVPK